MNARNIEYCKQRDVTCFKLNEFFVSENVTCDTGDFDQNERNLTNKIGIQDIQFNQP